MNWDILSNTYIHRTIVSSNIWTWRTHLEWRTWSWSVDLWHLHHHLMSDLSKLVLVWSFKESSMYSWDFSLLELFCYQSFVIPHFLSTSFTHSKSFKDTKELLWMKDLIWICAIKYGWSGPPFDAKIVAARSLFARSIKESSVGYSMHDHSCGPFEVCVWDFSKNSCMPIRSSACWGPTELCFLVMVSGDEIMDTEKVQAILEWQIPHNMH